MSDRAGHHAPLGVDPLGRILVVDDNESVRALVRQLLERWGYACEEAPNGAAALARLDAGGFSLVLTDYEMPGGDGLMLIRALAARARAGQGRTAAVLVSGSATEGVCEAALAAGAHAVLRKPFGAALLKATIERALGRQEPARAD